MLPLRITFRNFLSAFFPLLIFASCSERSNSDLEIMKALNETIEYSNKKISASNNDLLASLQNKLTDYTSRERASIWYPKAQMIQKISKDAIDNIEKIKIKLEKYGKKIFESAGIDPYKILMDYKKKILQVDPKLTNYFERHLKIFTEAVDASKNDQRNLVKNYFSESSVPAANAMLIKFVNNIILNEQGMIAYCNESCTQMICGMGNITHAIAIQSSTIVQAGEQIEIIAGLGSFSVEQKPEIFIYGKSVPLVDDRVAHYKLKTALKPGKYYVPVKINYIDQDGRKQEILKEMEYTVANIQKQ